MDEGRAATDRALCQLYADGAYSDLTVVCGDVRINAHKAVVCPRSSYFARACKDGKWKEGSDCVITLEAAEHEDVQENIAKDDPEAVKCMFDYMYLHDYGEMANTSSEDGLVGRQNLGLHVKVYALGDKYDVPSLKTTALRKFDKLSSSAWKNAEFPRVVEMVFESTPDSDMGLRNIVTDIIFRHGEDFARNHEMKHVIRNVNGLAYGLWELSAKIPTGPKCKICGVVRLNQCPSCPKAKGRELFAACNCNPNLVTCEYHRSDEPMPFDIGDALD